MSTPRRILVVTSQLPFPGALHGGGAYLAEFLRGLGEQVETLLLSLMRPGEVGHQADLVPPLKRVLVVPHRLNADMGMRRLMLNRMCLAWRVLGRGLPLTAAKFTRGALADALRAALDEQRPDAVLVEMSVCAQYLPLCAGIPSVLTDHEAGGEGPAWRRYVHRFYPCASLLQAVTAEDAAILAREFPRARIAVRPLLVPLPRSAVTPGRAGLRIGFLGNYLHAPNREAALFLVREVLPLLQREVRGAELLLAGEAAPPEIAALAAFPGVRYLGRIPSTEEFFSRVRCLVAPLFSGRGGRVKVLSALAHGLPVVTNLLGARGLKDTPPSALVVREGAAELAHAVATFLTDEQAAIAAGREARAWAEQWLDPASVARAQIERIAKL